MLSSQVHFPWWNPHYIYLSYDGPGASHACQAVLCYPAPPQTSPLCMLVSLKRNSLLNIFGWFSQNYFLYTFLFFQKSRYNSCKGNFPLFDNLLWNQNAFQRLTTKRPLVCCRYPSLHDSELLVLTASAQPGSPCLVLLDFGQFQNLILYIGQQWSFPFCKQCSSCHDPIRDLECPLSDHWLI